MFQSRRASLVALAGAAVLSLAACAGVTDPAPQESHPHDGHLGVLVMAHGGGAAWNAEVEAMLAPLANDYPLELAFGMAEAASLQDSVTKLEARGVDRIAVVRLFISGESFSERTEQILGLVPGAAPKSAEHADHGGHDGHGMDMALWRIETKSSFAVSKEGLADAPEMGAVLAERVQGLSKEPAKESVLILAHGPGDDAEDQRWLKMIDQRAEAVRRAGAFKQVQAQTLREDWPEKRVVSEARIRAFVEAGSKEGGRVIVIPYRVAGFGPYAGVLKGLDYVADSKGLLPSAEVEHWVRRQVKELAAGPFQAPQQAH
ncbi:MAG: CbiX/SirB N-terminal domain-containing protein [Hyphomonadaceae bacterium]